MLNSYSYSKELSKWTITNKLRAHDLINSEIGGKINKENVIIMRKLLKINAWKTVLPSPYKQSPNISHSRSLSHLTEFDPYEIRRS